MNLKSFSLSLSFAVLLFSGQLFGQGAQGCETPGRYLLPIFDETSMSNVAYGSNTNSIGIKQLLTMDVFEPVGDQLAKRPVIIWVHGGSFVFGNKNDMHEYADAYARLGYVTATIDYRLHSLGLGIPDSLAMLDAAIKAVGDLKAAVRYFRKDADTDNRFRIDPERIIVGGISAGAITALHAACLTEDDQIPAYAMQILEKNGGINGSTGDSLNRQYPSDAIAVVNLSGAIHRPEWITADDPPIASFHAKDDDVVPFGVGFGRVINLNIIRLFGSGVIHEKMEQLGTRNYLLATQTGGHTGIYTEPAFQQERQEFALNATAFLRDIICEGIPSTTRDLAHISIETVYPVPAVEGVTIQWSTTTAPENNYTLEVCDMQGRLVRRENLNGSGRHYFDREDLGSGMYLMRLYDRSGQAVSAPAKLIFR